MTVHQQPGKASSSGVDRSGASVGWWTGGKGSPATYAKYITFIVSGCTMTACARAAATPLSSLASELRLPSPLQYTNQSVRDRCYPRCCSRRSTPSLSACTTSGQIQHPPFETLQRHGPRAHTSWLVLGRI